MPDYSKSSNNQSKKPKPDKAEGEEDTVTPDKPERQIPKVVEGEVVIKKPGLGRKVKDIVLAIDVKDIGRDVFRNVIVPFTAKMAYSAWVESGSRVFYPNAPRRPMIDAREAQKTIFDYSGFSRGNPISRSSSIPLNGGRPAPPRETGPRVGSISQHASVGGEQFMFSNREDAVRVLDVLREALDMYDEPISLADVYDASGLEGLSTPVDRHWGWKDLSNVRLLQSNNGYILDFPKAESI